jgi:hypothetical protein
MTRTEPFGLGYSPTLVDRFGLWLSSRQIRAAVRDFRQLRVADIGCGYNAHFARTLLPELRSLALADLAIAEDLKRDSKITALEGRLPDSLAPLEDESQMS